jgi:hypothetical protein
MTRRALATLALSVVALLGAGSASALAGPGVSLRQGSSAPVLVPGSQIGGGLSIRGLLQVAGFNPGAVRFVQVLDDDGSVLTLRGAEFDSASVRDEGADTRFVRGPDVVVSAPNTPLEMTVDGNSLLSVRLNASATSVATGESITFSASVRFPPPGAQLSYTWDFGDGSIGAGAQVTHQFNVSGDLLVRVEVNGFGGSTSLCATTCGGTEDVRVQITGKERSPDQPQGTPQGGGDSTNLGGTGTGGTGSGTGAGGAGEDPLFAAPPAPPRRKAPPRKPQRPEPHSRFSSDEASGEGKVVVQGVLLAGSGAPLEGGLSQGRPAGSPKPAKGVPGTASDPSQIAMSLALALGIISLGALRERRRVRLRVA